jgi:two-component system response regulator (stage 0 sporulation protein F)
MIKFLIVDDEKDVTDSLADFFSELGYETHGAYNGKQAVCMARDISPDIVILDIKMEGMSGLEALVKIKKLKNDTRVIMLSALEEREIVHNAFDLGADEYMFKPFRIDILNEVVQGTVNNILGGRGNGQTGNTVS